MKKYIKKKDEYACSESKYKRGRWITRYFHLYCDICGVKHPDVCVNELCEEEGFPDGDYCHDCQKDLYNVKNRKCKQCKKALKDLKKAVKLHYFFDKPAYFCNSGCHIEFVKKYHPMTRKDWDKRFSKLSEKQKKIYFSRLRMTRKLIKSLTKEFGILYHLKGVCHAPIWMRPRYG